MADLIQVVQLPVIQEQLRSIKESVAQRVSEAANLVCTPETVQTVKQVRAELNREFTDLESQRKAIKSAILAPYEAFEAVFRECVSDAYRSADVQLKAKIDDTESEIKKRCEDELREYFTELCAVHHLEWLKYEQAGLKIGMTEAKQKTQKKLREQLREFVEGVRGSMDAIEQSDDAEEIMVEFKRTLNLAQSISSVQERHRRIEEERQAAAKRAEIQAREAEAEARVEETLVVLRPPEEVKAIEAAQKQILKCVFTVRGTKEQLIRLRNFMKQEGINYEC